MNTKDTDSIVDNDLQRVGCSPVERKSNDNKDWKINIPTPKNVASSIDTFQYRLFNTDTSELFRFYFFLSFVPLKRFFFG